MFFEKIVNYIEKNKEELQEVIIEKYIPPFFVNRPQICINISPFLKQISYIEAILRVFEYKCLD